MRRPLLALVAAALGCRHAEYAYAHTVTGVVLDGAGRPVAGAHVAREVNGQPDDRVFAATTDASGRFEMALHALAGEPQGGFQIWTFVATADQAGQAGTGRATVVAPWQCSEKGSDGCPGYHAYVALWLR